jgi:type I restriction enzyme S subunit
MNNIPKHWKELKINELTKVVGGGTPSTANAKYFDGDIPWISPVDLSGYKEKYISKGRRNISEFGLKNSSAKLLPTNTILFSSRAPIGYVAIAKNELCTNQGFKNLIPNEFYDPSYAYYYLKKIKDLIESLASGTTFKEISGSKMGEIPFLLAPLNEQKRIANRLDALFIHWNNINTRLNNIPTLLKQFKENVLNQAVTGKLTMNWRLNKNLSLDSWREIKLSTVADIVDPHPSHRTPPELQGGIPYIGIGDIGRDRTINFIAAKKVDPQILIDHLARYKLKPGDFIFGKIGTIGKPVIIPSIQNYVLSANVILIQPINDVIESKYLFYYLDSSLLSVKVRADTKSTSQPAYGIKKMRELLVPAPLKEEQKEIVKRVDELLAVADKIEESYKVIKTRIEQLPKSMLDKAFSGTLIDQSENDESASILLKRILKNNKMKAK